MPADLAPPSLLRLVRDESSNDAPADGGRRMDLRGLDISPHWELDLLPAAITLGDSPDGRPTVAIVAADDVVLHIDVIAKSPSEPDAIAGLLLQTLARARTAVGRRPVSLLLRHESLADRIRARLSAPAPMVTVASMLPAVDRAMEHLEREVLGVPPNRGTPRISHPSIWAAWSLAPRLVEMTFAAAAEFYRAAPWSVLANEDVLTISVVDGRTWRVVVMGHARQAYGLSLYESPDDLNDLLDRDDDSPDRALQWARGPVISLLFEPCRELSADALHELDACQWDVAGPLAYPTLVPVNTPGGGISEAQVIDLVTVLDVIPTFLAVHPDPYAECVRTGLPVRWTHREWPATVVYEGPWISDSISAVPSSRTSAPSGAQGPGAEPGAIFKASANLDAEKEANRRIVEEFESWLQRPGTPGRVSAATARKHARVAGLLADYMVDAAMAPLPAINEVDLRRFVYEYYPLLHGESKTQAGTMLGSLDRFLGFLAAVHRIDTPWRDAIIDDRNAFFERWETCPDELASPDALDDWCALLWQDLEQRLLLPPAGLDCARTCDDDDVRIVNRRWLAWRDQEIRNGVTDPAELRERLERRMRESPP